MSSSGLSSSGSLNDRSAFLNDPFSHLIISVRDLAKWLGVSFASSPFASLTCRLDYRIQARQFRGIWGKAPLGRVNQPEHRVATLHGSGHNRKALPNLFR